MTKDILTIPSSFGGGWAVPQTDDGRDALYAYYGFEPVALAPLGGREGYILEPCEIADMIEHLQAEGVTFGAA